MDVVLTEIRRVIAEELDGVGRHGADHHLDSILRRIGVVLTFANKDRSKAVEAEQLARSLEALCRRKQARSASISKSETEDCVSAARLLREYAEEKRP